MFNVKPATIGFDVKPKRKVVPGFRINPDGSQQPLADDEEYQFESEPQIAPATLVDLEETAPAVEPRPFIFEDSPWPYPPPPDRQRKRR